MVTKDGSEENVDLLESFRVELVSNENPDLSILIKYEIVNFDSKYLQLQIDNQDRALMSAPEEFKTIRIVFFGTNFFKSQDT